MLRPGLQWLDDDDLRRFHPDWIAVKLRQHDQRRCYGGPAATPLRMQLLDGSGVRAVHVMPSAEYMRYGMFHPLLSCPTATKPPPLIAATESHIGPSEVLTGPLGSPVRCVHVEAGAVELATRPSTFVLKSWPTAT